MKRMLAALVLSMFGVAPAFGGGCEDYDASSAAAAPPAQVATVSVPEATKVPASRVAKAPVPKMAKQAVVKAKAPEPEPTLAAVTRN